ncbi:hypothetical protein AOX56_05505 [Aeromonas sobria]|uniref:Uncharacterized protein n=1 Tax=Aeromonas sobria TaxID=646 RepID=A0A2N3IRK4_AERSO|nr:hypothetical protein [Aeromonas sobria]PKQ74330.1 hypothetical protein AOX56_05505 [Aeromonas sobria]
MRSYREIIPAINWRWITNKTLKALMYCINPLNFFKLIFRLFKWAIFIMFGAIALGMLTLAIGNYAHAAEWVPAHKEDSPQTGSIGGFNNPTYLSGNYTVDQAVSALVTQCLGSGYKNCSSDGNLKLVQLPIYNLTVVFYSPANLTKPVTRDINFSVLTSVPKYSCPPPNNPTFTFGPKVTNDGTICEKKPVQCLLGSVKDTNAITGKEFCRPICEGIAGNTYGEPGQPVSYFTSTFGSVKIQCYGQCSVSTVGGAINPGGNPNVWMGVIKFTGENCPIQSNGNVEDSSTAGVDTPVTPPDSSQATNNAQNQLQNAASSAISNTTSGATGTATLNTVVDKIAETSNKEIKANSEQNAALGKVIQQTGKDIQSSIKEAQLSASQGGAGAGLGQIQTANAIKDGNAQMGTKLDAIKDAIEKQDEGEGDKPLPPGDTTIKTDPTSVNPNPNDWGTRNYGTVMQQHVTAMNSLPLFSSISGFFEVNMGAGTCPSFSIDVPDIGGVGGGSLVFDVFCNADLQKIFEIIALCVKLLGLYAAFRIALLD